MGWIYFQEKDREEWDNFVLKSREARFIHLIGFKNTVERVYNLKPIYLLYKKEEEIKGIFASFIHNSILSGKKILSQPFSEYGGLLFDSSLVEKERIVEELISIIQDIMRKEGRKGIEIRGKVDSILDRFMHKTTLWRYGVKRIEYGMDLWHSVDYMVRKSVNKARREGVKIIENHTHHLLQEFYRLHLGSMRRLGSPSHPFEYFVNLQKELPSNMKILYAEYNGKIISALLGWRTGRVLHITDIPSNKKYFHLRANDLLHYEMMDWARQNGCELFDFGPIRYEGQKFYKNKWNLEEYEYSIYHLPEPLGSLPFQPPFYMSTVRQIWSLLPISLTKTLGRYLRREIGM